MSTSRTLKGLAGMLWRGSRTNSQFGEDIFVGKFFRGNRTGTWLDIGAFHPRIATCPGGLATRTVSDLLAETHPERLDSVSIDVEGLESDILAAFPFDSYTPDLFCVEVLDTTLDGVTGSAVTDLLARQGCQIVGWFPPSVFYARRPLGLGRA